MAEAKTAAKAAGKSTASDTVSKDKAPAHSGESEDAWPA